MESKQPLLDEGNYELAEYEVPERTIRQGRRKKLTTIAIHASLILLYGLISVLWVRSRTNSSCSERDLINSPAREALKYETQVFYSDVHNNPFAGPPRPELDEAWHGLLKNIHIKVSKEEFDAAGTDSLELNDGSGYVGSLEVYHDLHCLKRVRHFLYKETYLANMTKEEYDFQLFHTEHCLEHFRELVMCRGDVALTSFYWRRHEPTARLLAEHECVNWQALDDWAGQRMIDVSTPGLIKPEVISA